jgi:rhodanese-related sulfurtransferase
MENSAPQAIQDVDAHTLHAWLERGEAILIDVREAGEYASENIPGARLLPLSTFDPAHVPRQPGKKVVLHCVMGVRAEQAGQKLLDAGFVTVYNFRGGVQAWKDAGFMTEAGQHWRRRMSLPRQVQIVVGGLLLLGIVLGVVASPWWLLLSGAMGALWLFARVRGI